MTQNVDHPDSRVIPWIAAGVAAVAFILFAPSWSHPFVFDDINVVQHNPVVNGTQPWYAMLTYPYWPPDVSADPLYRPLTTASLRLDDWSYNGQPWGFHVTNSALHAIVSALVAVVAWQLGRSAASAFVAGLLFAVHPIHTEAVSPIVGRSEIWALLFILLMLSQHLRHARRTTRPTWTRHVKLTLLYAAACASKEHALLAVIPILAIDRTFDNNKRPFRQRIRTLFASHLLGLTLVATGLFLIRWSIFGRHVTLPDAMVDVVKSPLHGLNSLDRLATSFSLLALSFRLTCWPTTLCPIYGLGGVPLPTDWLKSEVLIGIAWAVLMIAITTFALAQRRRLAIPLSGLIVFLLIPCHFLPVANWLFAERWLYTSSAMILLALASTGRACGRPTAYVSACLIVPLVVATVSYQKCWSNTQTVLESTLQRQPDNAVALFGLCGWQKKNGDLEAAKPWIHRLIRGHADQPKTWLYAAQWFLQRGDYESADDAMTRYTKLAGVRGISDESRRLRREMNSKRQE